MMTMSPLRLALLYPGDRAMRDRADPKESRFAALFGAFRAAGVLAEPAVYHDDYANEVADQLRSVDGVLVWCNPIEEGRRRDRLDALLRESSQNGTFVSTHPDTILRLGTKDVLVETSDLPFGSDVVRVDTIERLAEDLPERLLFGPRVLKQHRGHSGVGVWRVERLTSTQVLVTHAQRGGIEESVDFATFVERMAPYFSTEQGGHMIDQRWQPRIVEGTVRAYLVEDRVAGFGRQRVNALCPARPDQPAAGNRQRLYHSADEPEFDALKVALESGWVRAMYERVRLDVERLPALWDCDFMYGDPSRQNPKGFVLCEVNVSNVSPFPGSAIEVLVSSVKKRLEQTRRGRGAS